MTTSTHAPSGVNYDPIDRFKVLAQQAGAETDDNIRRLGLQVCPGTRGESAFLFESIDRLSFTVAHAVEALGTKILVANDMVCKLGRSSLEKIARCGVAMIVNDIVTTGALPVVVSMKLSVASEDWFKDEAQVRDLITGWRDACNEVGCVYGPGETPSLDGIIVPGTAELSGAGDGIITDWPRITAANIKPGDRIVMIQSSGIHANGLTRARKIAENLPLGYDTPLSDGRSYGESLLDPTILYVALVEACQRVGIEIHYMVNMTGHGWAKLLRPKRPFVYVIEQVPQPQPIFPFLQAQAGFDLKAMYSAFNMGAGFTLYVPPKSVAQVLKLAAEHRLAAWDVGYIRRHNDDRWVEMKPLGFQLHDLNIR